MPRKASNLIHRNKIGALGARIVIAAIIRH